MTSTGPTGEPSKQAPTTSNRQLLNTIPQVSSPAPQPLNLQTAFLTPTVVQVLSAQPMTQSLTQPLTQPLLDILWQNRQEFLLELTDGKHRFLIRTLMPYPEGTKLTLHNSSGEGLRIIQQPSTINQLLALLQPDLIQSAERLANVPELSSNISSTLSVLQQLSKHATSPGITQAFSEALKQFTDKAHLAVKTLEQSITPFNKLSSAGLKNQIEQSGLFHEAKLFLTSTSAKVDGDAFTQIKHPIDYKTTLKTVLFEGLKLLKQFPQVGEAQRLNPPTQLAATEINPQSLNNLKQIHRQFYGMLQNLLFYSANPANNAAQTDTALQPSLLNHAMGVAALLNFMAQLSALPTTESLSQQPTGWSTLFDLLFGKPQVFQRKNSQTSTNAKQAMENLILQLRSQLNKMTAKQLALAHQQENNPKKIIYQDDLFFSQGNQIFQVPLTIQQERTQSDSQKKNQATGWQIELGFDLDHLGLIRTIAHYQEGRLKLTFQIEQTQTKKIIHETVHQLTKPLSKWGIQVESIKYQRYPKTSNQETENPFNHFVDIKL